MNKTRIEQFVSDIWDKYDSQSSVRKGIRLPVAAISEPLAKILNVPADTEIYLSSDTVLSHIEKDKGRGTLPSDYSAVLFDFTLYGDFYKDGRGRLCAFITVKNKLWQIGLKKTKLDEIYIQTVHTTNCKKLRSLEAKGESLIKGEKHAAGSGKLTPACLIKIFCKYIRQGLRLAQRLLKIER